MQEDPGQYQMKWLRYMKSSLISVKCYEINNSRKTDMVQMLSPLKCIMEQQMSGMCSTCQFV